MTRRRLLRLIDVAEVIGVSHQRVSVLRRRPDFPEPSIETAKESCLPPVRFAPGLGPTRSALGAGGRAVEKRQAALGR
jgi:hypothetical protein